MIELLTYACAVAMVCHALYFIDPLQRAEPRDGRHLPHPENRFRWLSTLLFAMVYGVVIEKALIADGHYDYHRGFLGEVAFGGEPIPIWIGVGWGVAVYVATWTAHRTKLPEWPRAVFAGLLAVGIDLTLDPVAVSHGFWTWNLMPVEQAHGAFPRFFGVPFDNFIGWFLIVTTYAFLVRRMFQRYDKKPRATIWVPFVAMPASAVIVLGIDTGLEWLYELVKADAPFFSLVFAYALTTVARHARLPRGDLRPDWLVLSVPLAYHVICWGLLVLHEDESAKPILAGAVIPLSFAVSILAFAWSSLELILLSRRPPLPAE